MFAYKYLFRTGGIGIHIKKCLKINREIKIQILDIL